MSDTPEPKVEQQQAEAKKSGRKTPLIIGALVLGAVAVLIIGWNAGWLTASVEPEVPLEPPEILSMSSSPERIMPHTVVTVSCEATQPDEGILSYTWSASEGEIRGEGSEVEWVAPATEGLHRIFVTVEDEHGASAEESLALRVRANRSPEITMMETGLGEDVGWVVPGARVHIWCEAEDPDGDSLTYEWTADAGELFGEGRAVIWIAPEELGLHWITVSADDAHGGVAERAIPVTVNAAEPPVIAGFNLESAERRYFKPYEDSWKIFRGVSCTIEALVDDEAREYQYSWSAEAGELKASGPHAEWTAPSPERPQWVTILLQVSDAHGNAAAESIRIRVETCPSCM